MQYTPADPFTKHNDIASNGAFVAYSGLKTGYKLDYLDAHHLPNLLSTTLSDKMILLGETSTDQ